MPTIKELNELLEGLILNFQDGDISRKFYVQELNRIATLMTVAEENARQKISDKLWNQGEFGDNDE